MEYKLYANKLVDEREDIIAAYGYGSGFIHQSGYKNDGIEYHKNSFPYFA